MKLFILLIFFIFSFFCWAAEIKKIQSIEYWQNQILENPDKAINYFNLAVAFHNQKSWNLAVSNYNKVIQLNSKLAPAALYYQALAFESLNQLDKTKNNLTKIKTAELTPELKAEVMAYKNKIFLSSTVEQKKLPERLAKSADEKRLSLFFDYNKGQNSNPDALNTSVVGDLQSQLKLGLDYLIDFSRFYDVKGNYYYSKTAFDQFTASNYVFHDLTAPLSFYLYSFRIKITPEFLIDSYDDVLFSNQVGLSADFSYKNQDNYFSFVAQTNSITNKTTSASYLTGFENKFQLGLEQNWSISKIDYKIYFSDYHYIDTFFLPSSYRAYGLSVGYTQTFFNIEGTFSGSFENKSYIKVNPNPLARLDQKFTLDCNLGYEFLNYFRIYLDGNYAVNKSNLDLVINNKNYSQSLISIGLAVSN